VPTNFSEQKVRVTANLGVSDPLGVTDPRVHMRVRYGTEERWIVGLASGNFTVDLALSSGGTAIAKAYPHDLIVPSGPLNGHAAYFGWPTGNQSVKAGHKGVFANGVPSIPGSGTSYLGGDGLTHTFGR
jgi:hypothetical protein